MYLFSKKLSYRFEEESLSFEKIEISLFGHYLIEKQIYVQCGQFTDNRRFLSSGRCIFTGSRLALVVDFNNIDDTKPEDGVKNRRMVYTPDNSYINQNLYRAKEK